MRLRDEDVNMLIQARASIAAASVTLVTEIGYVS